MVPCQLRSHHHQQLLLTVIAAHKPPQGSGAVEGSRFRAFATHADRIFPLIHRLAASIPSFYPKLNPISPHSLRHRIPPASTKTQAGVSPHSCPHSCTTPKSRQARHMSAAALSGAPTDARPLLTHALLPQRNSTRPRRDGAARHGAQRRGTARKGTARQGGQSPQAASTRPADDSTVPAMARDSNCASRSAAPM